MLQHVKQWVMRYRLPAFLIGVIVLAIVLVWVSVGVYYMSGAHQLDLSRPEYKSVRSQIEPAAKSSGGFDAQGEITAEALEEFLVLYKEEAGRAIEADAFAGDVLSDNQLGL